MSKQLPSDAAQIVLWFKGLPQPAIFLTTRAEAEAAMEKYGDAHSVPSEAIEFMSYPQGENRSRTIVPCGELRALTVEWPTIKLA